MKTQNKESLSKTHEKVESQTDYYFAPGSGLVFYDKTLKERINCPVHTRTQLSHYDGADERLNCPICTRLGLGLHWGVGKQIDEYREKVSAEIDRLIKKTSEW